MTLLNASRRSMFAAPLLIPVAAAMTGTAAPASVAQRPVRPQDFERQLRPTVFPIASGPPRWRLADRMAHYGAPGFAVAILRDGRPALLQGYGTRVAGSALPVDADTVFSVGSVSKVAMAALVLRLVAAGRLDLDRDVSTWLRRWRVPSGPEGGLEAVTLRMLLSHTSGFNVSGFADFAPDEPLPDLPQILNGVAPAKNDPLRRINPAGAKVRYSGGGVMIAQMVIEDAMGEPLEALARAHLFAPLGMARSTYKNPLPANWGNIAHGHSEGGESEALPRGWQSFPEAAASGLWTSARDMASLLSALIESYRHPAGGYLPRSLAIDMMTPVAMGLFGLGPRVTGEGAARIFHHGGSNASYKAYVEGNLVSGDGLIVMANGANGGRLGDEVRSAVSDTFNWPGDWSVATIDPALSGDIQSFAGHYTQVPGQPPYLAGSLDEDYRVGAIVLAVEAGQLMMQAGQGSLRPLAAVAPGRFVRPEWRGPPLQVDLRRGADGRISGLILSNGDGNSFYTRDGGSR